MSGWLFEKKSITMQQQQQQQHGNMNISIALLMIATELSAVHNRTAYTNLAETAFDKIYLSIKMP
jgi:hypothetical protein